MKFSTKRHLHVYDILEKAEIMKILISQNQNISVCE